MSCNSKNSIIKALKPYIQGEFKTLKFEKACNFITLRETKTWKANEIEKCFCDFDFELDEVSEESGESVEVFTLDQLTELVKNQLNEKEIIGCVLSDEKESFFTLTKNNYQEQIKLLESSDNWELTLIMI